MTVKAAPKKRAKMGVRAQKASRRASAHKQHIKNTYDLTVDQYQAIFEHQGGVCAICGGKRTYKLNVDHCHRTGFVRGLLCRLCNGRLLTAARDRPYVLRAAADYLENPPAIHVVGEHVVPPTQPLKPRTRRYPRSMQGDLTGG